MEPFRIVAAGAGAAPDRVEPAVMFATSGRVDAIILECLAERTIVPGLIARRLEPEAGADPRLRRRLTPLLKPAFENKCRIITNLGAANPRSAARQIASLANTTGCHGARTAAVTGDDVLNLREHIKWERNFNGILLGAHAYLGQQCIVEAIEGGADVVVTGRVADAALFSAEAGAILNEDPDALAGATTVGHLLECTGHLTGGNFESPVGDHLTAAEYADLGYPMAKVMPDGTAELMMLDDTPGRLDELTCAIQLLYEVHDPSAYITPDVIVDLTGVHFEQIGRNRVRVGGARSKGSPTHLKVSGFVEEPGYISDVEIGFGGSGALRRARIAAEALTIRLGRTLRDEDVSIGLVGVNSILGRASAPPPTEMVEARVHVSARCLDIDSALAIEDEVLAMSLSGPAGGGSFRIEKRPNIAVVNGLIDRELVKTSVIWDSVP